MLFFFPDHKIRHSWFRVLLERRHLSSLGWVQVSHKTRPSSPFFLIVLTSFKENYDISYKTSDYLLNLFLTCVSFGLNFFSSLIACYVLVKQIVSKTSVLVLTLFLLIEWSGAFQCPPPISSPLPPLAPPLSWIWYIIIEQILWETVSRRDQIKITYLVTNIARLDSNIAHLKLQIMQL